MREERAGTECAVGREHRINDADAHVGGQNKVEDHYGGEKLFFELVVHGSRLSCAPVQHDTAAVGVRSKILSARANIQQASIGLAPNGLAAKMTALVRRRSSN